MICINIAFSLPIYKNYNNTDILTTNFKLGSTFGKSEAKDLNFKTDVNGLNLLFELNPLYNITYLNNFYLGLNVLLLNNEEFKTNIASFNFSYNLPFIRTTSEWLSDVNIYITQGFGFKYIPGNPDRDYVSRIGKLSRISTTALGAEIYLKSLKDYKLAFYIEFRNIYSNYSIIMDNNKKCNIYKNSLVTLGLIYKTKYLIGVMHDFR